MKKVKQFTVLMLVMAMAIMSCLPVRVMAAKTNKVNMSEDYNKCKLIKLGKNTATSNDQDKNWVKYVAEEDGVYKITFSNFREKGKKSKKSDGYALLGVAIYDPDSGQTSIYYDDAEWSNGASYPVEIITAGKTGRSGNSPSTQARKVSTKVKVNAGTIVYISLYQKMGMGSSDKVQVDINLKKVK